jgi:hypothetical protein
MVLKEISIVNVRTFRSEERVHRCYRGFVLGNPFPVAKYGKDVCIPMYRQWFYQKIEEEEPLVLSELLYLYQVWINQGYLNLGCYCAPKECHTSIIKEFLGGCPTTSH